MFILHDGEVILGKSFENNYTSTGTQVIDEIANDSWPDIGGHPANKNLCRWDTSTMRVVLKTNAALLAEYKQAQFKKLIIEVNEKSLFIIVKKQLTDTPAYAYASLVTDIKLNRTNIASATTKPGVDAIVLAARAYYGLDSFEI